LNFFWCSFLLIALSESCHTWGSRRAPIHASRYPPQTQSPAIANFSPLRWPSSLAVHPKSPWAALGRNPRQLSQRKKSLVPTRRATCLRIYHGEAGMPGWEIDR
jgi:hypothetical protein